MTFGSVDNALGAVHAVLGWRGASLHGESGWPRTWGGDLQADYFASDSDGWPASGTEACSGGRLQSV